MERTDEQRVHVLLARQRLLPFVTYTFRGYHVSAAHRLVAKKLEAFEASVRAGGSPRLMLFLPPRFGKSQLASRQYPPWLLGRNPDWNVGIVSYGAELAEELSADARRVVLSDEYREVFGSTYQPEPGATVELDRSSTAVNHWRIAGHRGGVRAVGVGGALTGRGFEVIVIDDPLKGRKEADSEGVREDLWRWYQGTLRTRLEPGGGILLVQTRWHHDDLAGRLLEAQADKWETVSLPAVAGEDDPLGRAPGEPLDPLRYDALAYAEIRTDVGERDWYAQYQGTPTPDEGDVFHKDWFVREWPAPEKTGMVFQYWDTSHGKSDAQKRRRKGDYSTCGTFRVEPAGYRLIHLFRARLQYHELKQMAVRLREAWGARAVIVEDASSGTSLIQDLRNETRLPVLPWKVGTESKLERAKATAPTIQAGRLLVSVPPESAGPYIHEHLTFPNGKHDDMVDMTSMALAHLEIWTRRRQKSAVVRDFRMVA
jgi:predicted phage terminase large subunit-like protein